MEDCSYVVRSIRSEPWMAAQPVQPGRDLGNAERPRPFGGWTDLFGRFSGKAVVITGATSGIGRTIAEAFAREGARVLFGGQRRELGREVEVAIRCFGGDASYMPCDVRDPDQVKGFISQSIKRFGRLDVLYNNAGIFVEPSEIHDVSVAQFQAVMATNTSGVFFGMKHAIPLMREQGWGAIINMAAMEGWPGQPAMAAYSASRLAVIGLTREASRANAVYNVRVNSITPIPISEPRPIESAVHRISPPRYSDMQTLARTLNIEDIATAVMFLASDDATRAACAAKNAPVSLLT